MKVSFLLKKDNNNLDLVRIILASLVIIGHAPILNGGSDLWVDPIKWMVNYTYSGSLAVKIFFFISGALVTNSWLQTRDNYYFLISRFFRIMPALFFVLVVTTFIIGPLVTNLTSINYFSNLDNLRYLRDNLIFSTHYELPGVFSNNIYPNAVNGSLWSLTFEVGCYIVLFGIFLILGKKNKLYLNIPIILIIIDALLPTRILLGWMGDNPEINLLPASFAFGAMYAVNADKIRINFKVTVGIFLIFYVFKSAPFAQLLFVFATSNLAIYLASNSFFMRFKPKYDISYGVYLWGFVIQQTTYHYIGHVYVGLHCLIVLSIVFALALLTFIFIEKPAVNIGKVTFELIKKRSLKFSDSSGFVNNH